LPVVFTDPYRYRGFPVSLWTTRRYQRRISPQRGIQSMRRLYAAVATLVLLAPGLAQASDYAPLECSKANGPAEKAICKSYALGQAEARVATLFGVATSLVAMGQRGDIKDAQHKWIETRDACEGNVSCLESAYDKRIGALNAVINGIASRGPY
jgi:uncharacterized protein